MSHAALEWDDKDSSDVLDYELEWAAALAGGETISTSAWAVSPTTASPLTVGTGGSAPSISGTKTRLWLSGGLAGTTYTVTNTIATSGSRTIERSVTLRVAAL